jgi:EpsI family protein
MNSSTSGLDMAESEARPLLPRRRVLVLVLATVAASVAGEALRPTLRLAEVKPRIALERQVPQSFGDWRLDTGIRPVVPDPSLQAMLDSLYSQTLARTYVNAQGERVMLSIAYGSDQSNEATAVHRPEFCYSSQGFRVTALSSETLDIGNTKVPVARVLAKLGQRSEPITYWVTLDESATLPGLGRKLQQIRYGLRGEIPDGMLVRVSSISNSQESAFALQQRFLAQMFDAMPADVRNRYFGSNPLN